MAGWEGGPISVLGQKVPVAVLQVASALGVVDGSACVVRRQVSESFSNPTRGI